MSIKKEKIKVYDMTCTSCEARIERAIKKLVGVIYVKASFSNQFVTVEYDTSTCDSNKIKNTIKEAGYGTEKSNFYKLAGISIIAFAIIYLGISSSGIDMTSKLNGATYFVLFTIGILTSLHCIGMCGGIMLSQSINNESKTKFASIKPSLLYNLGRVVSYTILGGIVGALGSVLSLSITFKAALQIFAGVFMIIMGLNMSGFSIFRKINLKLPWSSCSIKKKPKTPFLVGVLNGLMPCGPLQTMQLYALGTGSAFNGALSMLLFSLGTVPLMLTFGALSGLLSKNKTKTLLKFSGILVIVLGIIMGNRGLVLAGIPTPLTSLKNNTVKADTSSSNITKPTIDNGVQLIKMSADGNGYSPNVLFVEKNKPVKWIIDGKSLNSCNSTIVIPSLNIQKSLKSGENVIEFTLKSSDISFSCWMGMINGVIKVVDNIDSIDPSTAVTTPPQSSSGMSCHSGGTAQSVKKPSIYGDDFSKVPTERIIHKSVISGNTQTAAIVGKGYEFEPLIIVLNKGIKTTLSIDLNNFDNPDGNYSIIEFETNKVISTFNGKKDTINVEFTIDKIGSFGIIKDNGLIEAIEVVDNINTVNLEKIRKDYIY